MAELPPNAATNGSSLASATPTNPPPKACSSDVPLVTFGTYNYAHNEILEDSTNQAVYLMSHYPQLPLIDTAVKYRNLRTIRKVLEGSSDARIGWKVEHSSKAARASSKVAGKSSQFRPCKDVIGSTADKKEAPPSENEADNEKETSAHQMNSDGVAVLVDKQGGKRFDSKNMYDGVAVLKANVPKDRVFRILLHNYCGKKTYLEFQRLVERDFGEDMPIGICNVSVDQLEDLMQSGSMSSEGDGVEDMVQSGSMSSEEDGVEDMVQSGSMSSEEDGVEDMLQSRSMNSEEDGVEDMVQSGSFSNENDGEETTTSNKDTTQKARVDWVQNEYHPFLETRVPDVCRKYGIRFEAHSIMTNTAGYADLFKRLGVPDEVISASKPAELALKYAAKQGGVCFATTNFSHLKQDLRTLFTLEDDARDDALLSAMSQFSSFTRIVRYKGAETGMNVDWVKVADPGQIRDEILPRLKRDMATFEAGKIPSNLCIQIPKCFRPGGKVHGILAEMMYGEDLKDQLDVLRKKLERKMLKIEATEDGGDDGKQILTDEYLMPRLVSKWNCTLNVLLIKMRRCITEAQANHKVELKTAAKPVQAVEQPEALPMDSYPEAEEFADLIQFIKTGGATVSGDGHGNPTDAKRLNDKAGKDSLPTNIRFEHGTINSDGRLDMCKQGFRNAFSESCDAVIQDGRMQVPVNIRFKYGTVNSDGRLDMCKQGFRKAFSESCAAVIRDKQNQGASNKKPLIEHYLIGNNRIGEDGDIPGEGNRRVAALARLIRHRPDIVTWFLAGNSMDSVQIQCVADALEQTQAKYVWLKMNPVKTGAYHLGKILVRNPHIELLDLFNCGLCNEGLAAFAQGLANGAVQNPSSPYSNLRHLYVSINAIDSARDFQRMLALLPRLESLFLSVNPFGDEGLKEIAGAIIDGAPCRPVLKRLNLGSMALTDASLPLIEKIVAACPNLVSLELDSYRSTNYFCQKHNRFDVGNPATRAQLAGIARALVHNARGTAGKDGEKEAPIMHYLGLQHALVVGAKPSSRAASVGEAKVILDEFVSNQLHSETGINVNGVTNLYLSEDGKSYSHNGEMGESFQQCSGTLDVEETSEIEEVEEKEASTKLVNTNSKVVCGGMLLVKGVTKEDLRSGVRHPWPAVDHIKSIYRNTMKV